jgi:ribosomal protein L37AE/L43A
MDPEEIINMHLNKQKKKELNIRICGKCKGEMIDQGIRTSGNVNYHIWECSKCSHEDAELEGLQKESIEQINRN